MRTRTLITTIAAGGILSVGALVAIPAFAGGPPTGTGPGRDAGSGVMVQGGMNRDGSCLTGVADPSGSLSEAQRTTLAANAEEEKLAHDLYTDFAGRYDAVVFDRIARAETAHLDAVRTLMARYGVTDPTAGQAQGHFTTPAVQTTYDKLLAQGASGQAAALEVGRTVETTDIADLRKALDGATAPDVQRIYQHLLTASQHHLTAFENWLAR
ncbi:MAG TPA: DUF2202 domain-containing protein [Amycolatopsis sp.]|uniref:DUF2202 domain-containing protein n=1 Tax=Amycolatopsis nalaikhensis TaxID=715472 RepID=A0ABY8XDZ1_9PSEU|nr:DUF2202 domain-containing protein [Amycolatopsis sp. 2-2]WIV53843.1 DUF2202 domain-containing protein [Amycolatopsis sp. 2-2]HWD02712.1 DUF2202 domain-containing protein [Amycolatopsis sp.]